MKVIILRCGEGMVHPIFRTGLVSGGTVSCLSLISVDRGGTVHDLMFRDRGTKSVSHDATIAPNVIVWLPNTLLRASHRIV